MKTSSTGVAFIAAQEGFVDHVYLDVAGIPTIGFGHTVRIGDPKTVTREQALVILGHDIASAESAVGADVRVPLTQDAFDALVSFTFNLGTGALRTSVLLGELNQRGVVIEVAREFLKWCHAMINRQLTVVQDLVRRRTDEAILFMSMQAMPRQAALVALGLVPAPSPSNPVVVADAPPVLPDEGEPTPPSDLPPEKG